MFSILNPIIEHKHVYWDDQVRKNNTNTKNVPMWNYKVHEINNNENVNSLSQLPDFLSDGPMGRMNQEPIEDAEPQLLLPAREINQVQQENERLRQQLENTMARERTALLRFYKTLRAYLKLIVGLNLKTFLCVAESRGWSYC